MCNFCRLWPIDGSCDGNFRRPPWPTEVTDFTVTFVGQVKQKPMKISLKPTKNVNFHWL
jgi:hypothetical protein